MAAKVNDKMIYIPHTGAAPQIAIVSRVTKTGHITITTDDGLPPIRMRPSFRDHYQKTIGNGWNKRYAVAYPYSVAMLTKAQADHRRHNEAIVEQERQKREHHAEVERRRAEEKGEVQRMWKESTGGDVDATPQILPDGARLYVLRIPAHPKYAERKKGYSVVIVRVTDDTRIGLRGVEDVKRVSIAAFNGGSCGFWTSIEDSASDKEAILEALRTEYLSFI